MIIEMYSLIWITAQINQNLHYTCLRCWSDCMFAPVCSCVAGFICALPSKFHFQIRSLSWTMTETKSGGRRLKWGNICGTFSFPQKCEKKSGAFTLRPSRSIVSESAAMFSGWSGTEKKDRKVLQSLCGSNREICDESSAQQWYSRVFLDNGRGEELSPAEETLQTDATLPPAAHMQTCRRSCLYTFQILQTIKVSNRFLLLQT